MIQTNNMEWPKNKIWAHTLHLFSITVLSLLVPVSFIVLARLTCVHHIILPLEPNPPKSLFFTLFFDTNPNLICALVSVVGLDALIHGLTDRISLLSEHKPRVFQTPMRHAWLFLATLLACVGLGIETIWRAGIKGPPVFVAGDYNMLRKIGFFVGLHETMICCCGTMVRPMVDGLLASGAQEAKAWAEWSSLAASYGWLWWWKLGREAEALVLLVEVKKGRVRVGLSDMRAWLLYYLTVAIGMIKMVKLAMWVGMVIWRRRSRRVEIDEGIINHRENAAEV